MPDKAPHRIEGWIFSTGIGNHFGLEAGYLRTTEEDKSLSGSDFLAGTSGKTETWIDGWHVDANGYVPLADKLEAIGSVGVGR